MISQQLSSPAERARASQAFLYWLKHSAKPAEQAAWDNKDLGVKDKQALLSKWLVYKARNFSTELSCATTQELVVATSAAEHDTWWSAERMDRELGPNKAQGLRMSKLLQTRPCRVTGSTEDHAGVPDHSGQPVQAGEEHDRAQDIMLEYLRGCCGSAQGSLGEKHMKPMTKQTTQQPNLTKL